MPTTQGYYAQFGVCQRQLDGLLDLLDLVLEAADVGVRLQRRFLHLTREQRRPSVQAVYFTSFALMAWRASAHGLYRQEVREREPAGARAFMTDTRGSASSDRMPTTDNTLLCKSTEHPGSSCVKADAKREDRSDPGQVELASR